MTGSCAISVSIHFFIGVFHRRESAFIGGHFSTGRATAAAGIGEQSTLGEPETPRKRNRIRWSSTTEPGFGRRAKTKAGHPGDRP